MAPPSGARTDSDTNKGVETVAAKVLLFSGLIQKKSPFSFSDFLEERTPDVQRLILKQKDVSL